MTRWLKRASVVLTLLGSTAVVGATASAPAYAINGVYCTEDGYLMISSNDSGNWCYANAGQTEIDIVEVWHLWSGNNAGYIEIHDRNGVRLMPFEKWTALNFDDAWASYLHIN